MDYQVEQVYETDEATLYRTSTGQWLTVTKDNGELSFITEQDAITIVHKHTSDFKETIKALSGEQWSLYDDLPQLIALILSQLAPDKAVQIICSMSGDMKSDLATRIALLESTSVLDAMVSVAKMERANMDILDGFLVIIEEFTDKEPHETGIEKIASILECMEYDERTEILKEMNRENKGLVSYIVGELLTFEDLVNFDDRAIQLVLKEVDVKELTIAMKGTTEELQEKIFRNVSQRVQKMVQDEMECSGPIHKQVVKEAQQHFINIVRRLEQEQQILIRRGVDSSEEDAFIE